DHVEAGLVGPADGADEVIADAIHVGAGHLARRLVARGPRDGGGGDQLPAARLQGLVGAGPPWALDRALAAGMGQLDGDARALSVDEVDDPPPGVAMFGPVQAGAAGGEAGRSEERR